MLGTPKISGMQWWLWEPNCTEPLQGHGREEEKGKAITPLQRLLEEEFQLGFQMALLTEAQSVCAGALKEFGKWKRKVFNASR